MFNAIELAIQAIETARAVCNESALIIALSESTGKSVRQISNKMLDDLQAELEEAKTKTVAGKQRPAGDFLVVEDPDQPSTWRLPVKVNGKPDHNLMGAAWAALHGGYRGNKYEGPDKAKATSKLKALYKSEDMPIPSSTEAAEMDGETPEAPAMADVYGPLTFADLDAEDKAHEIASEAQRRTYQYHRLINDIMAAPITDKAGALIALAQEFVKVISSDVQSPDDDAPADDMPEAEDIGEADGAAVVVRDATELELAELDAAVETGRRAPVVVDFQMIEPGPGNKRDNHYYPADMLERDSHVFNSADVFATDHKEEERSERTKVGVVIACPVRFTESRAPVAQVLLYDPDQAEKARNRADADALSTLECSIFGSGTASKQEIDGKEYFVVEELTQGKYLELVSKAGAGGHALNLAENFAGGADMTVEKEKADETSQVETETEEVDVAESEQETEQGQEETTEEGATDAAAEGAVDAPEPLGADVVEGLLSESGIPATFKEAIRRGVYADEDAVKAAIVEMETEVKRLSGSGQPFGLGASSAAKESAAEKEKQLNEAYANIEARYGVAPINSKSKEE